MLRVFQFICISLLTLNCSTATFTAAKSNSPTDATPTTKTEVPNKEQAPIKIETPAIVFEIDAVDLFPKHRRSLLSKNCDLLALTAEKIELIETFPKEKQLQTMMEQLPLKGLHLSTLKTFLENNHHLKFQFQNAPLQRPGEFLKTIVEFCHTATEKPTKGISYKQTRQILQSGITHYRKELLPELAADIAAQKTKYTNYLFSKHTTYHTPQYTSDNIFKAYFSKLDFGVTDSVLIPGGPIDVGGVRRSFLHTLATGGITDKEDLPCSDESKHKDQVNFLIKEQGRPNLLFNSQPSPRAYCDSIPNSPNNCYFLLGRSIGKIIEVEEFNAPLRLPLYTLFDIAGYTNMQNPLFKLAILLAEHPQSFFAQLSQFSYDAIEMEVKDAQIEDIEPYLNQALVGDIKASNEFVRGFSTYIPAGIIQHLASQSQPEFAQFTPLSIDVLISGYIPDLHEIKTITNDSSAHPATSFDYALFWEVVAEEANKDPEFLIRLLAAWTGIGTLPNTLSIRFSNDLPRGLGLHFSTCFYTLSLPTTLKSTYSSQRNLEIKEQIRIQLQGLDTIFNAS